MDTLKAVKHNPEPWDRQNKGNLYGRGARHEIVCGTNHENGRTLPTIARMPDLSEQSYANAERIVACVNACKGIPTEMLNNEVIEELLSACKSVSGYFCTTMNPAQMPATIKRAFNVISKIEAARAVKR